MIKENYYVDEIDYSLAMDTVVKNHYLHRKCPCSHAFGLFENNTDRLEIVKYCKFCQKRTTHKETK